MNNICHEPHFADFHDMAVVDPKTGKVGSHNGGNDLLQDLANTKLSDMVQAQRTIFFAWDGYKERKKLPPTLSRKAQAALPTKTKLLVR